MFWHIKSYNDATNKRQPGCPAVSHGTKLQKHFDFIKLRCYHYVMADNIAVEKADAPKMDAADVQHMKDMLAHHKKGKKVAAHVAAHSSHKMVLALAANMHSQSDAQIQAAKDALEEAGESPEVEAGEEAAGTEGGSGDKAAKSVWGGTFLK
jgi:uncharacterized protein (DUF305 family)